MNDRIEKVHRFLEENGISHQTHYHPPLPTIELALEYWKEIDSTHCKNLFFRNHKGNQHYLVLLDCDAEMNIHAIEQQLHQGKLSFASPERLMRYLGVKPGSVTPFGLINDVDHHVIVFVDRNLQQAERVSYHPCENTASLIIKRTDLERFLDYQGNRWEWIELY